MKFSTKEEDAIIDKIAELANQSISLKQQQLAVAEEKDAMIAMLAVMRASAKLGK